MGDNKGKYAIIGLVRQVELFLYVGTYMCRYFDLTALAARAFYSMLMRDVGSLCQQETLVNNVYGFSVEVIVLQL